MVTARLTDIWRRRKLTVILGFLVLCGVVVFVQLRLKQSKASNLSSKLDTKLEIGRQGGRSGFPQGKGGRHKAKGRVKFPGPFINRGRIVKKPGNGLAAGKDVKTESKYQNANFLVNPNQKSNTGDVIDDSKKVVKVDDIKDALDLSLSKNRQKILEPGQQGKNGAEVQELRSKLNRNGGLQPTPQKYSNRDSTQLSHNDLKGPRNNGGNLRNMGVDPSGILNGGNLRNMGVNPSGGLNGGNRRNMGVNWGLNIGNPRNMGVNPSGGLNGGNRRNMGVDPSGGLNGGNRRNMGVNPSGSLNGGNRRNMGVNPSGSLNGGNRRNMGVNPSGSLNGGNGPPGVGELGSNLGVQKDRLPSNNQKQQINQVNSGNKSYVQSTTRTGPPLSIKHTERQEAVVQAFKHAWKAYKTYAWGMDEVNPVKENAKTPVFGMGMTLVDSLDTMWLMGLKEEFYNAREWVAQNLNLDNNQNTVNLFETTIRVLGGLLSAYHLSEDKLFLDKAIELGRRLLPAFETQSDIPSNRIALDSGKHKMGVTSVAEAGSIQLEFRDLSRASGDSIFKTACDATMDQILSQALGMVPRELDVVSGRFSRGMYSVGAGTDSYYEYLLKVWLQSGKTENKFRDAYLTSVKQVLNTLVGYSKPSNMAYLGSMLTLDVASLSSRMEHLSCFYPGMLALGAIHGLAPAVTKLAENLTHTCYYMYNSTLPTHLAPDVFHFNTQPTSTKDVVAAFSGIDNFLRPETVESLFYLYRLNNKKIYQEWGWQIFQAFEKHSKLEKAGYTSLRSVYVDKKDGDKMESFFMAETLKYLFLLFGEDNNLLSLEQWVFNTEGHPLPIWGNTP